MLFVGVFACVVFYFYAAACRGPKGHGSGSVDAEAMRRAFANIILSYLDRQSSPSNPGFPAVLVGPPFPLSLLPSRQKKVDKRKRQRERKIISRVTMSGARKSLKAEIATASYGRGVHKRIRSEGSQLGRWTDCGTQREDLGRIFSWVQPVN